jgi:cell division protein FtsZ
MQLPPSTLLLLVFALGLGAVALYAWRTAQRRDRRIRVVGVGGGGGNAVDAMIRARLPGIEYVVVNTDARALRRSSARTRLAIGRQITNGLGTGGDARSGEVAARDATDEIGRMLTGSEFVVITAGLGGGTGSGAAPVIAEIARQKGALTMAVVTTPFGFEGTRRHKLAQQAAATLAGKVDAVATVPNDRAREGMPADATMEDAFHAIDVALCQTIGEILDLVTGRGRMNLDFADVRGVLMGGGSAAVGIGRASGENRAVDAARAAMEAAIPSGSNVRPRSVLVNLSGSNKLRLAEVDAVTETVLAAAGRDANLVLGMSVRPRLRDEVEVTVIATGQDRARSGSARATEAADAGVTDVAEVPATEAEAGESAAWQPVWLRRVPADQRAAPFGRRRRTTTTEVDVDASAASDTGADPS